VDDVKATRQRSLRYWEKRADKYDKQMGLVEQLLFRDTRAWSCRQARGQVLEVAVGTGLNFDHYAADLRVTGIELSPAMLDIARARAANRRLQPQLQLGDAHHLEFPDESFDSVVCTFSLCEIPDERQAITEMHRVLRPGGLLLLADHIASTVWPVRLVQRLLELITIPLAGEHMRRRPSQLLPAAGLVIERCERFNLGIVERLAARKPGP
jgi:ubiquinone/menaquinone biosynthesis C-methylase UbiE